MTSEYRDHFSGSHEDDQDFDPIDGRVIAETHRAYKVLTSELDEVWVPKSVAQEDGTGGLVVKRWFIDKEGLAE